MDNKQERKAETGLTQCYSFKGHDWGGWFDKPSSRRCARSRAWAKRQTNKARRRLDRTICA